MSPFKSKRQERYMWAEHPEIAERWAHEELLKKRRANRKRKNK